MRGLAEAVIPERLGAGFRWLLASSWITNLADGIFLAAGPLLIASQTRDPFLVSLGMLLQWLPGLLFGLGAGVVADRFERRTVIFVANIVRTVVLALLCASIVGDQIDIVVVLTAFFVLGTAEVFADTTAQTLLPMVVSKGDLGLANSRLVFGHITVNRLLAPPLGAALFAVGMVWPFAAQAVLVGSGAALVVRISISRAAPPAERTGVATEIASGARWLWAHPPIRTLTITVLVFNVMFGAAWSVLVLLALERLGLDALGFGFLTSIAALGGVVGAGAYGWLERKIGMGNLMRIGLIIETGTHLTLATTRSPALAMAVLFAFGLHEAVWATTATSIRQRAVPLEFQGRVAAVYLTGVRGGLVVGAVLGGAIASRWGVTGPFWFAFVGSGAVLLLIWRELAQIAHVDEEWQPSVDAKGA